MSFWKISLLTFGKEVSWISTPVCLCIPTRHNTEYQVGGAATVVRHHLEHMKALNTEHRGEALHNILIAQQRRSYL